MYSSTWRTKTPCSCAAEAAVAYCEWLARVAGLFWVKYENAGATMSWSNCMEELRAHEPILYSTGMSLLLPLSFPPRKQLQLQLGSPSAQLVRSRLTSKPTPFIEGNTGERVEYLSQRFAVDIFSIQFLCPANHLTKHSTPTHPINSSPMLRCKAGSEWLTLQNSQAYCFWSGS